MEKDKKSLISKIYGAHPVVKTDLPTEDSEALKEVGIASTPIVEIYPAMPKFGSAEGESGMQIFHLDVGGGINEFKSLLSLLSDYVETTSPEIPLRYAFLLDSLNISESFENSYRDSFFEGAINTPSTFFSELSRISGIRNIKEFIDKFKESQDEKSAAVRRWIEQLEDIKNKAPSRASTILNAASGIFMGGRIDFPGVWEGSTFSPSYTFTVRLINFATKNFEEYKKNILTPLTFLLVLACPISLDPYTFTFPLLVKAKCPGMFNITAGYISNISVSKGSSSFSFNIYQQPFIIDITVTINSLYNSIIVSKSEEVENSDRPTLKKYLQIFKESYELESTKAGLDRKSEEVSEESETQPSDTVDFTTEEERIPLEEIIAYSGTVSNPIKSDISNSTGLITEEITELLNKIDNFLSLVDSSINLIQQALINFSRDNSPYLFKGKFPIPEIFFNIEENENNP